MKILLHLKKLKSVLVILEALLQLKIEMFMMRRTFLLSSKHLSLKSVTRSIDVKIFVFDDSSWAEETI